MDVQAFNEYTFQLDVAGAVVSEVAVVALEESFARDEVESALDTLGLLEHTTVTLLESQPTAAVPAPPFNSTPP